MKRILICCFTILLFCSCASKLQKIEGVFVNEDISDKNRALFFLFQDDSLIIRSHEFFSKGFKLKYNGKNITVNGYNDSITFKITPEKHHYNINYLGEKFLTFVDSNNRKIGIAKISPISIRYLNNKPFSGYWKSTDVGGFDEAWMYINENNQAISVSYIDDELIEFSTNSDSTPFSDGKVLKVNDIYFLEFLSGNYNQETCLIDYLSDDKIQIFTKYETRKLYAHFKRVNFEYLPKELKEIVLKKEKNPTRFDYEGGIIKKLEVIISGHEEEEEEIIPIKIE